MLLNSSSKLGIHMYMYVCAYLSGISQKVYERSIVLFLGNSSVRSLALLNVALQAFTLRI